MEQLKVGYVTFQKHLKKLSRVRVPQQTCSQSAVRGVSTHDVEERAFGEQPSRLAERQRWRIKSKAENICEMIRQEVGPV